MAVNRVVFIWELARTGFLTIRGVNAGTMAYRPQILEKLAQMPHVVGIKEGSWETAAYEAHRLIVRRVAPHVAMMASGDEHLFTSYGQKIPNTCRHSVCSTGLGAGR